MQRPLATYFLDRGETAVASIAVRSGDIGIVTGRSAAMQRSLNGFILPQSPKIALTVTDRAATATVPAGWDLTLSPQQSQALEIGSYQLDMLIESGGGRQIVGGILIVVNEAASSPP